MPEFVEWMMGFPAGWTDGLARTHRLRMLGNAVVPQQAAHAMRLLTSPRISGGTPAKETEQSAAQC